MKKFKRNHSLKDKTVLFVFRYPNIKLGEIYVCEILCIVDMSEPLIANRQFFIYDKHKLKIFKECIRDKRLSLLHRNTFESPELGKKDLGIFLIEHISFKWVALSFKKYHQILYKYHPERFNNFESNNENNS
jgi:hypothetical protein